MDLRNIFDIYSSQSSANWKSLLFGPFSPNPSMIGDGFIIVTIIYTLFWIIRAFYKMSEVRMLLKKYMKALPRGNMDEIGNTVESWTNDKAFLLFKKWHSYLIPIRRESLDIPIYQRVTDASEVFNEKSLASFFVNNRFISTVPAIATGLGVLGTFVGLQLGIGGLKLDSESLKNLDQSIIPLIQGSAIAFSTSVWGVLCSLLFTIAEKFIEWCAFSPIKKLQNEIDALFPKLSSENTLREVMEATRSSDDTLKGLAGAIGEKMQEAIGKIGDRIAAEVQKATANGAEDLGKASAELIANALAVQMQKTGENIELMSKKFDDRFTHSSQELMKSVTGFHPIIEGLNGTVGGAVAAVSDAVTKLNAHESVIQEFSVLIEKFQNSVNSLVDWKDSLEKATQQNQEIARVQEKAADSNIKVSDKFEKITQHLLSFRETIEQAAGVIGSLGIPLSNLKELLERQPEIEQEIGKIRVEAEEKRSQELMKASTDLAARVTKAAEEFGKVSILADKLADSAHSLATASANIDALGENIVTASEQHRLSALASAEAASSHEKATACLLSIPDTMALLQNGLSLAGEKIQMAAEIAKSSYETTAIKVSDKFEKITQHLLSFRETIEQAAGVIGSLGLPLSNLKELLARQPEIEQEIGKIRVETEEKRSQELMKASTDLAVRVTKAAEEFGKVSILADKLANSAHSLATASANIDALGENMMTASDQHRLSALASAEAASSHEKATACLISIPNAMALLQNGLSQAGEKIRMGAEIAKSSYETTADRQEKWLNGIGVGLEVMRIRLQELIDSYGEKVEGNTRNVMQVWITETEKCFESYSAQLETIQGLFEDVQNFASKQK